MHTAAKKLPKKGRGFTWSRALRDDGPDGEYVQWRLHRWDMRGTIHVSYVMAGRKMMGDRATVAQWLRTACHKLRDLVDDIDIAVLDEQATASSGK